MIAPEPEVEIVLRVSVRLLTVSHSAWQWKARNDRIRFSTSFGLPARLSSGLLDHLDEHFPYFLRGCYLMEKIDTGTFDSFPCLQSKRAAQAVDGSHGRLDCLHRAYARASKIIEST